MTMATKRAPALKDKTSRGNLARKRAPGGARGVPADHPAIREELAQLQTAAEAVRKIRISAQRELHLARKMRLEAQQYQVETAAKANSQAQQLILHARLTTQREVEEIIGKASAEIQKVLADIRVIRITAQEELAAQKKFTDAARIASLSLGMPKVPDMPEFKVSSASGKASEETRKKPIIIKR